MNKKARDAQRKKKDEEQNDIETMDMIKRRKNGEKMANVREGKKE